MTRGVTIYKSVHMLRCTASTKIEDSTRTGQAVVFVDFCRQRIECLILGFCQLRMKK